MRQANPPGADRDLGAGQGRQRGGVQSWDTAADSGTRHGAQRRAAEAGGWQRRAAAILKVDGASHRERRWGAGARERGSGDERN